MTAISTKTLLLGAVAALGVTLPMAALDPAAAQERVRRECRAEGAADISMQARYEEEGRRKKFTVEMEAAPNSGFREGQRITFFVANQNVGNDRLEQIAGGDLIGELNLDTTSGPGDDTDPFPPNFPRVRRNTEVQIQSRGAVVLGCALR